MSHRAHETTLRVRYAETDRMGVVYYANYQVWFEVGRNELMRAAGYPYTRLETAGVSLPITSGEYRLVAPARYDDEIRVVTRILEVKTRRVVFGYEVRRGDELLATGSTTHVPVAPDGRVVTLPPEARAALSSFAVPR
jgi:acyl-CoA thioester hydrolase